MTFFGNISHPLYLIVVLYVGKKISRFRIASSLQILIWDLKFLFNRMWRFLVCVPRSLVEAFSSWMIGFFLGCGWIL